jgi:hypothetical protein
LIVRDQSIHTLCVHPRYNRSLCVLAHLQQNALELSSYSVDGYGSRSSNGLGRLAKRKRMHDLGFAGCEPELSGQLRNGRRRELPMLPGHAHPSQQ